MKKFIVFLVIIVILLFVFSCAGTPQEKSAAGTPEQPPQAAVLPPEKPQHYIMGQGKVDKERLAFFLLESNPKLELNQALMMAGLYIEEAALEGVDHDVAFSQMCLETGFLAFGNLVSADMNNFCGLGSTGLPGPDGLPERGHSFPDPRTGVRAHIQHLKAYGSTEPLNQELVNPRFRLIQRGRSPTIEGLAGTWATDREYANKISVILQRLYEFAL